MRETQFKAAGLLSALIGWTLYLYLVWYVAKDVDSISSLGDAIIVIVVGFYINKIFIMASFVIMLGTIRLYNQAKRKMAR